MRLPLVCSLVALLVLTSCADQKVTNGTVTVIPKVKQTEAVSTPFTLVEGDEISVSVWRQEDLKRNVTVDPSGNINYPLIGEVKAAGLTIPQLTEAIASRLSKYVVDPQVDISVLNLKGQEVYVLGEVEKPGAFLMDRKTSALEAIAKAGGFTRDSNTNNVLLVRSDEKVTRISAISLGIENVQKAPGDYQDVSLRTGDILFVPPQKIANIEKFMTRLNNIIAPIIGFERSIILGGDAYDTILGQPTGTVIAQ